MSTEKHTVEALSNEGKSLWYELSTTLSAPWVVSVCIPLHDEETFLGSNLFTAFQNLRRSFEEKGLRFLCQGARANAIPSGMSISMSGGRLVYLIEKEGSQATTSPVEMFAPASAEQISTVKEQEEFKAAHHALLRKRLLA